MMTTKIQRVRRWGWRIVRVVIPLWLCVVVGLMAWIHHYGTQNNPQKSDVIIVLGAGLNRSGAPGPALTRRANHAADLWEQDFADFLICTGGQAYPAPRSEAAACREILLNRGIPAENILMEDNSRSTEENALGTLALIEEYHWQSALIVSDSYHVFRAGLIFDHYDADSGIALTPSPVASNRIHSGEFYLYSLAREVVALHWWTLKLLLNISATYVPIL